MHLEEIKARLMANKKTSIVGVIIGVVSTVAVALHGGPFEPYANIGIAAASFAGSIALLWAKD